MRTPQGFKLSAAGGLRDYSFNLHSNQISDRKEGGRTLGRRATTREERKAGARYISHFFFLLPFPPTIPCLSLFRGCVFSVTGRHFHLFSSLPSSPFDPGRERERRKREKTERKDVRQKKQKVAKKNRGRGKWKKDMGLWW